MKFPKVLGIDTALNWSLRPTQLIDRGCASSRTEVPAAAGDRGHVRDGPRAGGLEPHLRDEELPGAHALPRSPREARWIARRDRKNVYVEASSIQVAYSVGGASIRLAEATVDNAKYNTGVAYDRDATTLSVSLAF